MRTYGQALAKEPAPSTQNMRKRITPRSTSDCAIAAASTLKRCTPSSGSRGEMVAAPTQRLTVARGDAMSAGQCGLSSGLSGMGEKSGAGRLSERPRAGFCLPGASGAPWRARLREIQARRKRVSKPRGVAPVERALWGGGGRVSEMRKNKKAREFSTHEEGRSSVSASCGVLVELAERLTPETFPTRGKKTGGAGS